MAIVLEKKQKDNKIVLWDTFGIKLHFSPRAVFRSGDVSFILPEGDLISDRDAI